MPIKTMTTQMASITSFGLRCKKIKKLLTSRKVCDIIRVQNRGSAFGEGEPPTARHPRGSIPLPLPLLQCLRLGRSVGAVMRVQVQPLEKKIKKMLDKCHQVWYNESTMRGEPMRARVTPARDS